MLELAAEGQIDAHVENTTFLGDALGGLSLLSTCVMVAVSVSDLIDASEDEIEQMADRVRDRIDGDLGAMPIAQAIEKLEQETSARTVRKTHSGHAGLSEKNSGHEY